MNYFKLLITLLFYVPYLSASTIDSTYIKGYNDQILLKLSLNNKSEEFRVNSNDLDYTLRPNIRNKIKFHLNYNFISAGFSVSPKFLPGNNSDEAKGKSREYAFDIDLSLEHWMQGFAVTYTKGYYLVNTEDYDQNWTQEEPVYIQFPDLVYLNISGYTAYRFNTNYSIKATTNQTERQLKSAGSFIPLIFYRHYTVDDKTPITGTVITQKSNNFESGIQLGYAYTLVIAKHWTFSPNVSIGGGFIHTSLLTRDSSREIRTKYTSPILRSMASVTSSYRTQHLTTGIRVSGTFESYPENNSSTIITNNQLFGELFFAYLFTAPHFLKKSIDKIPFSN